MNGLNLTKDSNIWAFISTIFQRKSEINRWYIAIRLQNKFIKIYPSGSNFNNKIYEEDIDTTFFNELMKNNDFLYTTDSWTFFPISIKSTVTFFICFEGEIEGQELEFLKFIIESLLENESKDITKYPSFLPFFIPLFEDEIQKINLIFKENKKFFFLNGLPGTGKKTFINNYLLYNYNTEYEKNSIRLLDTDNIKSFQLKNVSKKIFLVNELAFLTENEQLEIVNHIKFNEDMIIFISSNYDPITLSSRGVLIKELENYCIENRIIFPSLMRRKHFIRECFESLFFLKGIDNFNLINENFFKKQSLSGGFNEILQGFQKYFSPQISIWHAFSSGQNIRDMVKKLEILGIEFGQWIIGNSQNKISKFLGMSRGSLQHKLKKYNYPYSDWEE